jgi:hypothetical protein
MRKQCALKWLILRHGANDGEDEAPSFDIEPNGSLTDRRFSFVWRLQTGFCFDASHRSLMEIGTAPEMRLGQRERGWCPSKFGCTLISSNRIAQGASNRIAQGE